MEQIEYVAVLFEMCLIVIIYFKLTRIKILRYVNHTKIKVK